MTKYKYFHQFVMWLTYVGAIALFYIAWVLFQQGEAFIGAGMLIMGLVAMANYYLHKGMMKGE